MNCHSKHTFMFPFQWDYNKNSKQNHYNDRTDLDDFCRLFEQESSAFNLVKFAIDDNAKKFNEYTYFYAFARKALYYLNNNSLSRYYELDVPKGEYNIEFYKNKTLITKQLHLDSICIHVFETGIGIISYNLTNIKYADKKSILEINEFGRRLYPQFMSSNDRMIAKKSFLPNRIFGEIGDLSFEEDFSAYEDSINVDATFLPPDHIKKVFGYKEQEQIGDLGKKFVFRKQDEVKDTIRIRQVTDDRMFFLCWYGNDKLADSLKTSYKEDDFWYAYMFGDQNPDSITMQNKIIKKEHIEKVSYVRWLNYGSLFGVTRDAFVGVSSSKNTLNEFNAPPIDVHMQTMYYQMAVLCLVQRASILRFGWEISQITNQIFREKQKPERTIKELYENYIRFINQIYFREVTSQIQGIELYTMFQKAMNIEKEAKDLDGEMQELFNYLSVREQSKLGRIANLFLPVALLAGVLGINTLDFETFNKLAFSKILTGILILWVLYVFGKQMYYQLKK